MSAALDIIAQIRAAGGTLKSNGNRLRLRADAPLSPELVDALRACKTEVLALLQSSTGVAQTLSDLAVAQTGGWNATDWQALFQERAGIAEFDGLSRPQTEARAFECCIAEWLHQHPHPPSEPEQCAQCGEAFGGYDGLPFLTEGGHIWLHDACHAPWYAARRAAAAGALMEMGIHVGQC